VSVFRLNLSHGTHDEHRQDVQAIRAQATAASRAVGILADLQGPKIRVGRLRGGHPVLLQQGERFDIVADPALAGTAKQVGCSYPAIAAEVSPGEPLLLDDGNLELRVVEVQGPRVTTEVVVGGLLREHKGINLPGTRVQAPSLSDKDLADLQWAIEQQVDFVALSFVRTAAEVQALQERLLAAGSPAEVIAKIERPEAIENIAEIIDRADGIMVARGDLGVELGPESVPTLQKQIIQQCIAHAKPVITATQMMESMVENPRPTRAEASDVANAVYDGSSALMLSAETAIGRDPARAVGTMQRLALQTEKDIFAVSQHPARRQGDLPPGTVAEATVAAAARAALQVDAAAIATFTETGATAKLLARERLRIPLVAFTASPETYARLTLQWGIRPRRMRRVQSVVEMQEWAEQRLLQDGLVKPGDRLVLIAGTVKVSGATNTMMIRLVEPSSAAEGP
jgi:pyruvate kinase